MSSRQLEEHPILFSCFHDYIEDLGTTRFLMNAMKEAVPEDVRSHILFESFYNLAVMEDGSLALPDGRTVSFLYRMHPMEILIEEKADQDGSSLGELMMEGYGAGRFHMMNPPESIIMQSKGFQALLYALMEDHAFFSEKNRKSSGPIFRPAFSSGISGQTKKVPPSGSGNPSGAEKDGVLILLTKKGRLCIGKKWKIRRTWCAGAANPPWYSSTYRSRKS